MENFIKKYGVSFIILILTWQVFQNFKQIGPHNQVIRADGKGYYAYLPAVFIYRDHQMNFLHYYESKYNLPEDYAEFRVKNNGVLVDKYFVGEALLQLPFFLLAHGISYLFHQPTDGYAPLYQQFFALGVLVYLFIGMQAFFLFLMAWKIKAWQGFLVICILVFGTNCYHYAVYEQSMSHVFSLSMFCIFIYGTYQVIHKQSNKWIIISLFILGIILILRPVNIIILGFVPFIAGSRQSLAKAIKNVFKKYDYLIFGIIAMLIPVAIQSLLWHWETGQFLIYSYGTEAMEWENPKIWHVLFSYSKGWFVWTPIAFIGLCGLVVFIKDLYRFFAITLFMCLAIYVLSCWWTPDYGAAFGAREFIEYSFVPAIGLPGILQKIKRKWLNILFISICFLTTYVNLTQEIEYRHHIILWNEMDKESYWRVFLQTSPSYYYFLEERQDFKRPDFVAQKIDKSFTNDFETYHGWENESRISEKEAHSGSKSNYIDASHGRSAIFSHILTTDELKNDSSIQASIWFYGSQPDITALVISFETNNKVVLKNDMRIRKFADHNYSWNRVWFQQAIPKVLSTGSVLKVYVDNKYNSDLIYLDDLEVDFIKK